MGNRSRSNYKVATRPIDTGFIKSGVPREPKLIPEKWASQKDPSLVSWHDSSDEPERETEFPYQAVDGPAEKLCDELIAAKINPKQALIILEWHNRKTSEQEISERALIVGRIVGELLATKSLGISIHGLAFACGLDQACGLGSQADAARRLGVTRAAVGKLTSKWRDVLGMNFSYFTRSPETRQNCSEAQSENHWRHRKHA